jgi:hypothetical protein
MAVLASLLLVAVSMMTQKTSGPDAPPLDQSIAALKDVAKALSRADATVAVLRPRWGEQIEDAPNGRRYRSTSPAWQEVFVAAERIGAANEHIRFVKFYAAPTSRLTVREFEVPFGAWQAATPNPDGNPFVVRFVHDDKSFPHRVDIHVELSGPRESGTTRTLTVTLYPDIRL